MSDKRYTVRREGTGDPKNPWVVRFCGDWVGSRPTKSSARGLAHDHAMFRV